jgi:hypothetical protein
MNKTLFIIVIILLPLAYAEAGKVDISASGAWNFTITAADLTAGAGSDIKDKVSASNATLVTVSATGFNWKVNIRRSDSLWHGNLGLYTMRTSNGTGSGIVSGGTSYVPIGTTDTQFLSGSGSKSNMSVQYKLSSSVSVPPGSYSTTVIYTIIQQ